MNAICEDIYTLQNLFFVIKRDMLKFSRKLNILAARIAENIDILRKKTINTFSKKYIKKYNKIIMKYNKLNAKKC
jgi:hypothetical protein